MKKIEGNLYAVVYNKKLEGIITQEEENVLADVAHKLLQKNEELSVWYLTQYNPEQPFESLHAFELKKAPPG